MSSSDRTVYGRGVSAMNIELLIAGLTVLVLAFGHAVTGALVLAGLSTDSVSKTPFGPADMSVGMVRFTWHVVTVVLFGIAVLVVVLALGSWSDPRTLILRWLAGLFAAAATTALMIAGRTPRYLLRLPGPVIVTMLAIAALCWHTAR